ncbi:MAG TPA: endonuclease III [Firmicutes bacterium]|nr:endonuclease III [Bacillota bacterium]
MENNESCPQRVEKLLNELQSLYPDAACGLNYRTPFELLVATILSAQSTDKKVNQVTARLFAKAATPEQIAALTPEELEEEIRELGLYRHKARYIIAAARAILAEYGGELPKDRAELMTLPGVGRKTANVVLGTAFAIPAFPVDTHVFRVARRLGLAAGRTPLEVEEQLMQLIPENLWIGTHHRLIRHGRLVCTARRPHCPGCALRPYCPTGRQAPA